MCQYMNTYKLQKGSKTLHPILVPLRVRTQIGPDLTGPLKEINGYMYIATF